MAEEVHISEVTLIHVAPYVSLATLEYPGDLFLHSINMEQL